jgi:predicted DNA-binding transcriptional regulator AlpA
MKTDLPPDHRILVDSTAAAALCNVSRSTWLGWDSTGQCPRSIRIGGRVLWCRQDIERWAAAGCPARESMQEVGKS